MSLFFALGYKYFVDLRMRYLIFLLLLSCQTQPIEPEYPKEIKPYIQKFIIEGQKRGVNVDFNGLKVFYLDSLPLNQYQGYYSSEEHAIYLKSGSRSWLNMNDVPEETVIHELGHAILKRGHLYDTFQDGRYKSVMATPYVRWSKHPETEKYYYDELFDRTKFGSL